MSSASTAAPFHFVSPVARRFRRGLLRAGGVVAFSIAAIGALHTPLGRPLLARLGVGCPVTRATPQQIDHARTIPAAAYLGKPRAPARPVLGFGFEKTTIADVEAWAGRHGIACGKLNGNETLRACKNVPAAALGQPVTFDAAEEVDFEFRAAGTLAVATVLRRGLSVAQANAMVAAVSSGLRAVLGPPQKAAGANSAAHFAKGPLQAYQEEYEFGDYGATLTAARLGNSGVMFREQYFSPLP